MKFSKPILLKAVLVLILLICIQFLIILTPIIEQPEKSDAIIVLGCHLWGEQPSPMLSYRLEKALELYNEGYAFSNIIFLYY